MTPAHETVASDKKPRALIIGARGFLGRHLARAMATDFEVIKGIRVRKPDEDGIQIDIRRDRSVTEAFEEAQPELVLLLAALSDIDLCQRKPEDANAVNVRGTEHVVNACRRAKARLLYMSSAAVFDGYKHGYCEEDEPCPISVYGKTKAQAEAIVSGLGSAAIIVRIALALGFAGETGTNALLDKMASRWRTGETIALPAFEQRNPIDTATLSRFIIELVKHPGIQGIFHVGAIEPISRYDLGLKLAARMGYREFVQPELQPASGRAPRGRDHYLLPNKISRICSTPVPSCDQVIERCFDGFA